MPLYGKVSDIYGRRFALRIAIALYMLGSLVCASRPNMLALILGRALHGLGGGGLASMGAVILGDVTAPRRGRYYASRRGLPTAGASGPALGGFLSDYLHWSAIFWLNIPLPDRGRGRHDHSAAPPAAARPPAPARRDRRGADRDRQRLVHARPQPRRPRLSLDVTGDTSGSSRPRWWSGLRSWRLLTAPEPLIPIAVLRNRSVLCSVLAHSFGWGSIIGLNIFLPTYLQSIVGLTPTDAGLSLMMLMIALNVSAGISSVMLGTCIITRRSRSPAWCWRSCRPPARLVRRPPDACLVRGAAHLDRSRLRAAAGPHPGLGAEFRRAPSASASRSAP